MEKKRQQVSDLLSPTSLPHLCVLNKCLHLTVSQSIIVVIKITRPSDLHTPNLIISLIIIIISRSENYLLLLGLHFRPTPRAIPICTRTLKKQIDDFSRSILRIMILHSIITVHSE